MNNMNIDLTFDTRDGGALENLLESQLDKRMKRILPSNLDIVDYDRDLL